MIRIILILLIITITQKLNAQVRYGIGLDYGRNILLNVNPDELTPYGHSGKQSGFRSYNYIYPKFWTQFNIYKDKFYLNAGLGYGRNKYHWDFNYIHRFGPHVDVRWHFSQYYIEIPISINYKKHFNKNNYLSLYGGMSFDVQIYIDDNYIDIILEEIGLSYDFSPVRPHYTGRINYGHVFNNPKKSRVEMGGYLKYDGRAPYGVDWGFLKNLEKTRNLQMGLGLIYYFE